MNFYIENCGGVRLFGVTVNPQKILHRKKNNKAKPKKNRKILFGTDRNEMVCVFGYKGKRATSQKISSIFPQILQKKKTKTRLQFIALFCLTKLVL